MQSSTTPSTTGDSREESTTSPFFTLSAELRNCIYELALGGKTIHILAIAAHRPTPIRASMCLASNSDEPGDAPCRVVNQRVRNDTHNKCINHSCRTLPTKVDLALLSVCRQIYEETALIPHASNNFLIHMQEDGLWAFMEHMTERHLANIQQITLDFSCYGNFSPERPFVDLQTLRRLFSVRKVSLVVKPSHIRLGQRSFQRLRGLPRLKWLEVTVATRWDDTDLVMGRAYAASWALREDLFGRVEEQ